ncbi:metallophosphoesterase [Rhizobium sullae]|uniref:Quinolinate synthetase n=1 Tax=Rhizobium sullae TaxID=50338 RepID=A0A4R3PZA4_RHISU|nr:metallophosphoesterase [Rhizobium sullae]TCU11162.1 quinolinate synthetase [Rhizobium sullae]
MKIIELASSASRPVYAVGDVHGMAGLLEVLLATIDEDADKSGAKPRIVFLGDIVDRGPESRRAMELVHGTLQQREGSQLILGNHDYLFREALNNHLGDLALDHWVSGLGGKATLRSYTHRMPGWAGELPDMLLPRYAHHLALLNQAADMVLVNGYCLVHAGIDPKRPLAEQSEDDLREIREDFLDAPEPLEKVVVHGHTITDSELPEIHSNRIAIDTGAYRTGRLSAVVIAGNSEPRFLYVSHSD